MRWPWRRNARMGWLRIMRLAPGDTVVLQVKEALSSQLAADFSHVLAKQFPAHKVLVLHGGMELSVIREDSSACVRAPEQVTQEVYHRQVNAWHVEFPDPFDVPPLPSQRLG